MKVYKKVPHEALWLEWFSFNVKFKMENTKGNNITAAEVNKILHNLCNLCAANFKPFSVWFENECKTKTKTKVKRWKNDVQILQRGKFVMQDRDT